MNRYLVMAVLDESVSKIVRKCRGRLSDLTGNRQALKFPVHITLRGPFRTGVEVPTLLDALSGARPLCLPRKVVLGAPAFIGPDLCWLPVSPASEGFQDLLAMHLCFENALGRHIAVDQTPRNHKREDYRPHVTLGWGASPAALQSPGLFPCSAGLTGTLERVALAKYPEGWPARGIVRIAAALPTGDPPE